MPTKTKEEHKYVPPSFIDKKFIKTLSKEKKKYWANRIEGKPGSGEKPKLTGEVKASDVATSLDNNGNVLVHNRETRRTRPETPNFFTKATNSIKKERLKDAKQQHIREAAKARKARRARNSQIS